MQREHGGFKAVYTAIITNFMVATGKVRIQVYELTKIIR